MRDKSFKYLIIGQSLANLCDIFYIVAIISLMYQYTNSPLVLSLIPLIITTSSFISSFLAPLLIDRYRLKDILVYSQSGKTLILFFLTIYIIFYNKNILLIFLLIFMISFLDGWANPTKNSLLPRLVDEEFLIKANSLSALTDQSIRLGGWAIGGLALSFLSIPFILWTSVTLYILSTTCMYLIKDYKENDINTLNIINNTNVTYSFFEGWKLIILTKSLRIVHSIIIFETIASTVWLSSILYIFIVEKLKVDTSWWGYINTSLFVGILLAASISYKWSLLKNNISIVLLISSFVVFLTTLLFGLNIIPFISLVLIFLNGFFDQLKAITLQYYVQSNIDSEILPKIYSAQATLVALSFGISTICIGFLADYFNISIVFFCAAAFLIISPLQLVINKRIFNEKTSVEI